MFDFVNNFNIYKNIKHYPNDYINKKLKLKQYIKNIIISLDII